MTSEMYSRVARLASFDRPKHTSKKRTSTQTKKKTTATISWPHQTPRPDDLARAGFFFQPDDTEGDDNVKCFSCRACLNGWEPDDDPLKEHIVHRPDCNWAIAASVTRREGQEPENRDPLCEELLGARLDTFNHGPAWPHENGDGWLCTIQRMVEAGWCFDAGPEYEDGATCFYCELQLDGWEPEDDPLIEHRKRRPECRFFELLEQYHGGSKSRKKSKSAKAKAIKSVRLSKASRSSAQSTMSLAPSEMTAFDDSLDDEIAAEGAKPSQQAAPKAKKSSRSTAIKSSKGRKKPQTKTTELSEDEPVNIEGVESARPAEDTRPVKKAKKTTKKSAKASTASTIRDADDGIISPDPRANVKREANQRVSDDSTQLQEELEGSIIDQFPEPSGAKSSRGKKRSSDGSVKNENFSALLVEFPSPPSATSYPNAAVQEPLSLKQAKKSPSVSSSQTLPFSYPRDPTLQDALLDDDEEQAIELELARIEAEQQMRDTNAQRSLLQETKQSVKDAFDILQDEVNAESYYYPMQPLTAMTGSTIKNTPTPSPNGSDKENNASSLEIHSNAKSTAQAVYVSPTKTTRIPLAPSTPNRVWPTGNAMTISPRKLLGTTRSTKPWKPIDLDSVLLVGPQATPGKLREQLVTAAGSLTAEEHAMTVEQWIRVRARQQEEELQRRGEEMVATFEAEGNRALGCLEGMHVAL